jgi:hypothetical protein
MLLGNTTSNLDTKSPEETKSISADSDQRPLPMESVKINYNNIEILF